MEKRALVDYIREPFHGVILFLEDLNYIENLFLEENIELSISTDLYEGIKSISELKQTYNLDMKFKEITFKSYDPYIEFSFSENATLFCYDFDKALAKGLIIKVKEYLSDKTVPLASLINAKSYSAQGFLPEYLFQFRSLSACPKLIT